MRVKKIEKYAKIGEYSLPTPVGCYGVIYKLTYWDFLTARYTNTWQDGEKTKIYKCGRNGNVSDYKPLYVCEGDMAGNDVAINEYLNSIQDN